MYGEAGSWAAGVEAAAGADGASESSNGVGGGAATFLNSGSLLPSDGAVREGPRRSGRAPPATSVEDGPHRGRGRASPFSSTVPFGTTVFFGITVPFGTTVPFETTVPSVVKLADPDVPEESTPFPPREPDCEGDRSRGSLSPSAAHLLLK